MKELEYDFNHMLESGMFYGDQPDFNQIIKTMVALEKTINGVIKNKLGMFTDCSHA